MNKKKLVIIYLLLIFFDMWKYSFWLEKKPLTFTVFKSLVDHNFTFLEKSSDFLLRINSFTLLLHQDVHVLPVSRRLVYIFYGGFKLPKSEINK